uniref:Cuticular protein n=1 Tax=Panagrellus redivivus TaxID=6233 RepID=A0A7E4WBG3_PANRE
MSAIKFIAALFIALVAGALAGDVIAPYYGAAKAAYDGYLPPYPYAPHHGDFYGYGGYPFGHHGHGYGHGHGYEHGVAPGF